MLGSASLHILANYYQPLIEALAFLENQLKFCICFVLIFNSVFALADDLAEINKLGGVAISLIEQGELSNIVSKTTASSSLSKYLSEEDIAQSDATFERNMKLMGKYYSSEVIHEGGIKGAFWSRWYLIKFERQPLMIYMEFYKPNESWEVHSMRMDSDLSNYIHDAGQAKIGFKGMELDK